MRILIDTNTLISAILNPGSIPSLAVYRASHAPNSSIISEYNLNEIWKIFSYKFPDRINDLETFLFEALGDTECMPVPKEGYLAEKLIRDKSDRPILRTAIYYDVDVILTGDKDFLEANIIRPQCLSPRKFLELDLHWT